MSSQQRIDEVTEPDATNFERADKTDAGSMARAKMVAKASARKMKSLVKWTFILLAVLVVCSGIGRAVWGYYTQEVGFTDNFRNCSATVGGLKITGTRSYHYPYRDFLGMRMIDKTKVIETTRIDLTGDVMTIVPVVNDGKEYGKSYALSERGSPIVKNAPVYVIVSGKNNGIIDYEAFCKTQPRPVTDTPD